MEIDKKQHHVYIALLIFYNVTGSITMQYKNEFDKEIVGFRDLWITCNNYIYSDDGRRNLSYKLKYY